MPLFEHEDDDEDEHDSDENVSRHL
jgi:hypothetical protein